MGANAENFKELIDRVYEDVGLDRYEARLAVDSVLRHIQEMLLEGRTVTVPGFGKFCVRVNPPRSWDHALHGHIDVPAKAKMRFYASRIFNNKLTEELVDNESSDEEGFDSLLENL